MNISYSLMYTFCKAIMLKFLQNYFKSIKALEAALLKSTYFKMFGSNYIFIILIDIYKYEKYLSLRNNKKLYIMTFLKPLTI